MPIAMHGAEKAFPLHRWPKVAFSSPPVAISRTATVFDCTFGAIRQWAGPRNGRFDPVRKTPLQCGWSQQMSITILGDENAMYLRRWRRFLFLSPSVATCRARTLTSGGVAGSGALTSHTKP